MARVRFPVGAGTSLQTQTVSGTQPSVHWVLGSLFPHGGVKLLVYEGVHSHPSGTDKNICDFTCVYLNGMVLGHGRNFTFTLTLMTGGIKYCLYV
jgi:hypothetical protein